MFCGLEGQEKSPRYLPPPSLRSVPISSLVEVTWTLSVALAFELVASTRNCLFPAEYSATCTDTVSVAGGVGVGVGVGVGAGAGAAVTVNVAVRVTPPNAA